MYELEDNPPLPFAFKCEFNGNNSFSCTSALIWGVQEQPDAQTQQTDYWLPPSVVDLFKDEVKSVCHPFTFLFIQLVTCFCIRNQKQKVLHVKEHDYGDDENDPTSTCITHCMVSERMFI